MERNSSSFDLQSLLSKKSYSRKQAFILSLLTVFLVLSTGLVVYYIGKPLGWFGRAQQQRVDLSLVASQTTVAPGDEVQVNVYMTTNSLNVSAVEVHLAFNPSSFEAVSLVGGNFLPVVLPTCYGCPGEPVTTSGGATIILGSNPDSPVQGTNILATLTLQALNNPGTSEVLFDAGTKVAAVGYGSSDMTGSLSSTTITIQAAGPTPTPTLTPAPSPTPMPTLLGDINGDCVVNVLDAQLLSNAFGTADPDADLNKDGIVNVLDAQILSNNFGERC